MQVGELGKVAKCVVLGWQELQERSADSKQLDLRLIELRLPIRDSNNPLDGVEGVSDS